MSAALCPHCAAPADPLATSCAYCGGELRATLSLAKPAVEDAWHGAPEIALHPMSLAKLAVMSVCTLGLYNIFWFYRNWKLRNELRMRGVMAPLRSIFAPLFAFSLFEDVDQEVRRWGVRRGVNAVLLGIAYFALSFLSRLPDPWWVVTFAGFIPLVPVQRAINAANAASSRPARVNDSFSTANIVGIVMGGILIFLAIIGTLFPTP